MTFTSPVTTTPVNELLASFVANIKGLNDPISTSDRVLARRAISITTAMLYRLNVLKAPTPIQKLVFRFRAKESKNIAVYQKTVVLAALIAFTTVFELKNDRLFNAVDTAKIVLFEELVELGFDFLDIEKMILEAGTKIEETLEA